jgi:hypothetical protein
VYLKERARAIEALVARFVDAGAARQRVADLVGHVVVAHATALERLIELATDRDVLEDDPELAEVLWVHRPVLADAGQLDRYGNQIESLMAAIEQSTSPELMAAAAELAGEVRDMYGEQLERAFELLHDSGQGAAIRAALDDDLVSSLLVVHDLHPRSMTERVRDSLAALAETLPEHGGVVRLLDIDEAGHVKIEITGGSELHRWRTRLAVEKAIDRAAPDHGGIEVVGADDEPPTAPHTVFIPVDSVRRKAPRRTPRTWIDLPELLELADGAIRRIVGEEVDLIACNLSGDLYVAVDSFGPDAAGSVNGFRMVGLEPLTVESDDGRRMVFDAPLPVQRTDDTIEVMVP